MRANDFLNIPRFVTDCLRPASQLVHRGAMLLASSQIAGCSGWEIAGSIVAVPVAGLVAWSGYAVGRNAHTRAIWHREALDYFRDGDYEGAAGRFHGCRHCSVLLPGSRANALVYSVYEAISCRRGGRPDLIDTKVILDLAQNTGEEYPAMLLSAVMSSVIMAGLGAADSLTESAAELAAEFSDAAGIAHGVTARRMSLGEDASRLSVSLMVIAPAHTTTHPDDDADPQIATLENILVTNTRLPWKRGDFRRLLNGEFPHAS